MGKKLDCYKFGERGEELKVSYYASTVVVCDGNLLYIKVTCLNLP